MSAKGSKRLILVAGKKGEDLNHVQAHLANDGFDVITAADGSDALDKAHEAKPALVILDSTLRDMSSRDVLRKIKSDSVTCAIPVIILSEKNDEVDPIIALELGADDHLSRPFSVRELTLRVKAILSRRATPAQPLAVQTVGPFTLDRNEREVRVGRKVVELTSIEFRMLSALIQGGGAVLSRERLIESVWGSEHKTDSRTVDTHLRRLRAKLGAAKDHVETVRGFGNRLRP